MTDASPGPGSLEAIGGALEGRFEILEEIGRGGMATVFLAEDLKHLRRVAVKVLRPELAEAVGKERFLAEIRTTANLSHPHILPLFDSGEANGFLFYVMPLVRGESLRARLERETQLPLEDAVQIAWEVADALAFAHGEGVIHRDVKPANILLEAGHAVLADFGVAQAFADAEEPRLTRAGFSVGTPAYMSPEQATGEVVVDGRSDQYSLGCVLYEMIAGEPPFSGASGRAVMAKHLEGSVPSLAIVRPGVPDALSHIVEKSLKKSPADRFPSTSRLAEALSAGVLDSQGSGTRLGGGRPTSAPRSRDVFGRASFFRWAGLLAVLAAVVLGGWKLLVGGGSIGIGLSDDLDPNKVVVFPLADRGGGAEEAEKVAYVLYWALEHTEPLKWIDGWRRLTDAQRADINMLTEEGARAIALDRGAGFFIDGAVVRIGDSLSVSLLLHDTEGDSIVAEVRRTGLGDAVTADHLGLEGMIHLLPPLVDPGREIDLSYLLERDPAAIALWIQGEREYRQAHWNPALDYYRRAVETDPNLSFAAIKGAQAAGWAEEPELGRELAEVALSKSDDLPRKYRAFAEAFLSYVEGRPDEAVIRLREALAEDPDWSEAWTLLGETYHHFLPSDLNVDTSAASAFGRAFSLDSTFVPPLIHLTEYAMQRGDLTGARDFIGRLERVGAADENLNKLSLMHTCLVRGPSGLDWREASNSDTVAVINAADHMAERGTNLGCSEAAYRWVLGLGAPPDLSYGAIVGLQGVLAMQNRVEDLTELLNEGAEISPVAKLYFLLDEFAGMETHSESEAFVEFVKDLTGGTFEGVQPRTLWMIGSWLAYHGDPQDLELVESALNASGLRAPPEFFAFSSSLFAHRALASGDSATAMVLLASLPLNSTRTDLRWNIGAGFPFEVLQLSRIHFARGEAEDAIRVASLIDHLQPFSYLPFIAESLGVRHRAAQALGDSSLAVEYRERLLELGREDLIEGADPPSPQGGV